MDLNKELENAVKKKSHIKANLFLEQGADPNAVIGNEGWTVLMEAAQRGFHKCVWSLLNAGANVNATTTNGHATALTEAFRLFRTPSHYETVCILMDAGADVNRIVDVNRSEAKTPLLMVAAGFELLRPALTEDQRDGLLLRIMAHGGDVECVTPNNESLFEVLRLYENEDSDKINPGYVECLKHSISTVNKYLEQKKLESLIHVDNESKNLKF